MSVYFTQHSFPWDKLQKKSYKWSVKLDVANIWGIFSYSFQPCASRINNIKNAVCILKIEYWKLHNISHI